jgi:Fic family protein
MDRLELYMNGPAPDRLVQLAIVHAEFEAIHPFLDGNGRLGRLMVPLFLYSQQLLSRPNFYMSEFLEQNRDEYYARLLSISAEGDWTGWCAFFLQGLIAQADINQRKAQSVASLYRKRLDWMAQETRSQYAVRALTWMFSRPIFRASDFAASADIPQPTAARILRIVREQGLLREIRPASGRRAATLAFVELLNIAEGRAALLIIIGERLRPLSITIDGFVIDNGPCR